MKSTKILDLVNNIRKLCIANDDELMNALNISLAEFNFFLIYDERNTLSSESLAKNMNLSLSRVSRVIDRMVQNGLLIREINLEDKRAIKIELSEKGQNTLEKVRINKLNCEKNIRKKLSKEESLELESNLKRILSLL